MVSPVLSPGKRFSRVTSAYSVLPLRGAAPVLRGAGSVMERQRLPYGSLLRKKARVRESTAGKSLCYLWLQRILRSRLIFCVMPGMAQGAWVQGRPVAAAPVPRAPASKIAATRSLRLIPAGFGSGRGSVRAKHGPQPASMRAAPAFRERLSDFEAVSTGSFSNNGE